MQLFLCDFELKGDKIIIEDKEILYQLRKVLRMKIGDKFFVQKFNNPEFRYELEIIDWDDKNLIGKIQDERYKIQDESGKTKIENGMIICMPNKWDEIELIVQKLSEIGIDEIIFWSSERSVLREFKVGKMERLKKISKEAIEQSWGWNLPKIEFVYDLKVFLKNSRLIVFDKCVDKHGSTLIKLEQYGSKIYGLVGPEGGLTNNDYKSFGNNFEARDLGENILRTETAAIIGGRTILNYEF